MSKEMSRDEELAWEVFKQGLDVTSGELVDGARMECENPLTTTWDFLRFTLVVISPIILLIISDMTGGGPSSALSRIFSQHNRSNLSLCSIWLELDES